MNLNFTFIENLLNNSFINFKNLLLMYFNFFVSLNFLNAFILGLSAQCALHSALALRARVQAFSES